MIADRQQAFLCRITLVRADRPDTCDTFATPDDANIIDAEFLQEFHAMGRQRTC
jgi:hypothetical protein